jgi:hypothetical protein
MDFEGTQWELRDVPVGAPDPHPGERLVDVHHPESIGLASAKLATWDGLDGWTFRKGNRGWSEPVDGSVAAAARAALSAPDDYPVREVPYGPPTTTA